LSSQIENLDAALACTEIHYGEKDNRFLPSPLGTLSGSSLWSCNPVVGGVYDTSQAQRVLVEAGGSAVEDGGEEAGDEPVETLGQLGSDFIQDNLTVFVEEMMHGITKNLISFE